MAHPVTDIKLNRDWYTREGEHTLMSEILDADLRRRTWELLQPGEIALDGLVVHTAFDGSQETAMHQARSRSAT